MGISVQMTRHIYAICKFVTKISCHLSALQTVDLRAIRFKRMLGHDYTHRYNEVVKRSHISLSTNMVLREANGSGLIQFTTSLAILTLMAEYK